MSPFARPSIRRRLAVGLACLGLMLFGLIGLLEYLAFDRELQRAQQQTLRDTLAVVLHLIDDTRDNTDPDALSHRLDDVRLGHEGTRVWLIGHDGRLRYGDAPAPIPVGELGGDGQVDLRFADNRIDRGIVSAALEGSGKGIGRAIVTVDAAEQDGLRRSLARILVLCLAVGTFFATLLGFALSVRALRPLALISRQANALSATSIGDRLPEDGVAVELMDLVASFNRALGRIESAFCQQQAFSADVAHELNTPLTTLIAGVELELAAPSADASSREFLTSSLDDLHRLKGIVRDMLFLARADQGTTIASVPRSSLAAVVREVIDYHEAVLGEAGLTAHIVGDADAPVDAMLIKRALSNLLSNASRYARSPSQILIRIDRRDGRSAANRGVESDALVRMSVTNVGEPLAPELADRMFDRFHRGESSRAHSDQHHGLGLAIVSAIARMHGGTTFAESTLDTVTVGFTVRDAGHR